MAAANTDKLKKLARRWVGQIGSGGVVDGVTTTIPLSSVTNLPTDTAVVATIDRVDANGAATSTLEETVIGVVSGSSLINCVRGAEGTAQAHDAGKVVEILVTAKGYNDIVDWGLVEHSQLGVHSSALVTTLKATGAEVTTGTSDLKIATPKAIKDAGLTLDTDTTLAANSDLKIATQKAVKAYVASSGSTITPNLYAYNAAAGYTTTSTSFVDVDATNLKPTITTTSSHKVRIMVSGSFKGSTSQVVNFKIVRNPAGTPVTVAYQTYNISGSIYTGFSIVAIDAPSTGANVYTLQWSTNTGTATMAESTYFVNMAVEEIQA